MAEEGISVVSRLRKPLSQAWSRKQRSVVVSKASVCLICSGFQIATQREWAGGSGSAFLECEKSSGQGFPGKATGQHVWALALLAVALLYAPTSWAEAAFVFLVCSEGMERC